MENADAPSCRIAIVTPSFARDYALCVELNESVLRFMPKTARHYLVVDGRDLPLFRPLENARTIVVAVEDVIPRGYYKVPASKKWWFSTAALVPTKGWIIQQLVKLSMPQYTDEDVLINVDSDVLFVRPVSPSLFFRSGRTRIYRMPQCITAGMQHVKWHRNVCRLLDVPCDPLPMDEYVGNMISWDSRIVLEARARIEDVTGSPWHVAFTRGRLVSEYFTYGLYVDKVLGGDLDRVWYDERPWCHTYWGPGPLQSEDVVSLVASMRSDDVAFSVAGYTETDPQISRRATQLVLDRVRQEGTDESRSGREGLVRP